MGLNGNTKYLNKQKMKVNKGNDSKRKTLHRSRVSYTTYFLILQGKN